jgi:EAL domain-containing protein (putative c-di-GMP-specific phosphodiesterase class I)
MGCDLVQGRHLSRPTPTGDLVPWVAARERSGNRAGLRVV